MSLTEHLSDDRRGHVEARLRGNLIAWLTTVRPDGQPVSVPVWFLLREDDTFLLYSQAGTAKIRNIDANPRVALGLDVTDLGRDVIRIEGLARPAVGVPPANENLAYVAKYRERIGAMFETAENFASAFPVALVVTPTRLWA